MTAGRTTLVRKRNLDPLPPTRPVRRSPASVSPCGVEPSATRHGYPAGEDDADPVRDALIAIGRSEGLAAVGVTHAGVFEETRRHLVDRRRTGLSADMQFTYRNPDRSTDPGRILPGARSLVVGAWSYRRHESDPSDESDEPDRRDEKDEDEKDEDEKDEDEKDERVDGRSRSRPVGWVARYARRDHYASLRHGLDAMAGHLRSLGWRAMVVCDDNALTDRAAAHRAGIGWFGKNSLILVPGSGSWVVLGAVVTDAPLAPSAPEGPPDHAEGCGSCARCLTACPTGALVAPGVLDARRCLAWLVQATGSFPEQYRRALGGRDLRMRRVSAGLPHKPGRRAQEPLARSRGRHRAPGGPGRPPQRHRRRADGGPRPLVHPRPRSALPAEECAGRTG